MMIKIGVELDIPEAMLWAYLREVNAEKGQYPFEYTLEHELRTTIRERGFELMEEQRRKDAEQAAGEKANDGKQTLLLDEATK